MWKFIFTDRFLVPNEGEFMKIQPTHHIFYKIFIHAPWADAGFALEMGDG